jgi:hypothetical protein
MIKQKTIMQTNAREMKNCLDEAIRMGWLIHSVIVNSETNCWFAVLYQEAA